MKTSLVALVFLGVSACWASEHPSSWVPGLGDNACYVTLHLDFQDSGESRHYGYGVYITFGEAHPGIKNLVRYAVGKNPGISVMTIQVLRDHEPEPGVVGVEVLVDGELISLEPEAEQTPGLPTFFLAGGVPKQIWNRLVDEEDVMYKITFKDDFSLVSPLQGGRISTINAMFQACIRDKGSKVWNDV